MAETRLTKKKLITKDKLSKLLKDKKSKVQSGKIITK